MIGCNGMQLIIGMLILYSPVLFHLSFNIMQLDYSLAVEVRLRCWSKSCMLFDVARATYGANMIK